VRIGGGRTGSIQLPVHSLTSSFPIPTSGRFKIVQDSSEPNLFSMKAPTDSFFLGKPERAFSKRHTEGVVYPVQRKSHGRSAGNLLSPGDAAEYLGIPEGTLAQWRSQRRGPPYLKLEGRLVRYRVADLEAYLSGRLIKTGAD
jgi:excisionase family DNA binding protein